MSDFYADLEQARKACNKKQREFALSMASGLTQEGAFCEVYGQKHRKNRSNIKQRCAAMMNGPAGKYYGLLISPMHDRVIAEYALKREERLNLLSMGAVLAFNLAKDQEDVKAINPMVRCVNELNRMTGEHAPDQVEVKGHVLHAAINSTMSNEQATELYKQAIKGARLKLEAEEKDTQTIEGVAYEPIVSGD